jgi:hypothetical protein
MAQEKSMRLGEIEFFGYAGFDPTAVRASLPVHEGDVLANSDLEPAIERLRMAISQSLGRPATDIKSSCCDNRGNLMIYVGLPGRSSSSPRYNPLPKADVQLPSAIVDLYEQSMALAFEAAQSQAVEESSAGYVLSAYPSLRTNQLAMREFALREEVLLIKVLTTSGQAEERRTAAHVIGYGNQSRLQLDALVSASSDVDDEVRNNAVRALALLAESNPKLGAQVPPAKFIAMLGSNVWKDRNQAAVVLESLSRTRDRHLLNLVHKWALEQLVEMAQWRSAGDANPARLILARIAGIDENHLQQLVSAGQSQAIIDSLRRR